MVGPSFIRNFAGKSEKGNSVVIVSKTDCLDKMENLLNDSRKFGKGSLTNNGILSFICQPRKTS